MCVCVLLKAHVPAVYELHERDPPFDIPISRRRRSKGAVAVAAVVATDYSWHAFALHGCSTYYCRMQELLLLLLLLLADE